MGMTAVTGAFSQLLAPGLNGVFFMHLKDRKTEYEQIFYTDTSDRNYEENLEMAALSTMPQKNEGTPITYQDFIQGGVKRFTHVTFALGFRVTEEMMEDDLYGPMKKSAKALKRSAVNSKEVLCFNVLNNSFTTEFGFPKGGINQPLVSTSHTLIGGGTASNKAAVDTDISFAALEAAILYFNTVVDERSLPLDLVPETLVYHPADLFLVTELLNSDYRPFTANNEVNPLKNRLTPMWSRYLTDTDAWWVVAEKSEDSLIFWSRRDLRFQAGDDFDTGDAKFKASWRGQAGCSEWRNLYGSPGA
jgi:hypothetical protein